MLHSNFLQTVTLAGTTFTLRAMNAGDRAAILNFARSLSEKELSFMRRDITRPDQVDDWIRDLQSDRAITLLAESDGRVAGYGTLYYNQFFWNRHLAEVRILVSMAFRERGLGTRLGRELIQFAKELGLDKVLAYMAVEDQSPRHMLENLGFRPEAVLTDWVKTRDNRTHDLLIMSIALRD